jgi:hypothetical protein
MRARAGHDAGKQHGEHKEVPLLSQGGVEEWEPRRPGARLPSRIFAYLKGASCAGTVGRRTRQCHSSELQWGGQQQLQIRGTCGYTGHCVTTCTNVPIVIPTCAGLIGLSIL